MLRYLADAYRALRQTVPDEAKTEELADVDRVARRAGAPGRLQPARRVGAARRRARTPSRTAGRRWTGDPSGVTRNVRAFRVLVRNALFRRVELAALRRWDLLGELDAEAGWDAERWREALEPYFAEHDDIGTGPDARGPQLLTITEEPQRWIVRQILDDPAGDHDWGISAEVDLAASDEEGAAVVWVTAVEPLGGL